MTLTRAFRGRAAILLSALLLISVPGTATGAAAAPSPRAQAEDCRGLGCLVEAFLDVLRDVLGGQGEAPGGGDEAPSPPDGTGGERGLAREGVFHEPTRQHQVERITMRPPPGTYRSVRLQLDIYHGGWSRDRPRGTHNIFWLARESNRDMIGFVNIRNQRELFARHGFGMTHTEKARITTRARFEPGRWYRFDYRYDAAERTVRLVVTTDGREVARLRGRTNIASIRITQNQRLRMTFGFLEGHNPQERATYGWRYANLRVTLTP